MSAPKTDRPRREPKPNQHADCLYSFPPSSKQERRKAQKNKTKTMKGKPETIHWDMQFSELDNSGVWAEHEDPFDAQFVTHRPEAWKRLLRGEYPHAKWEDVAHGEQMKVKDYVSIIFYLSGKVMVQGPSFKAWAENDFPRLKDRLDQTVPKSVEVDEAPVNASGETIPKTCDSYARKEVERVQSTERQSPLQRLATNFSRLFTPGRNPSDTPQRASTPHNSPSRLSALELQDGLSVSNVADTMSSDQRDKGDDSSESGSDFGILGDSEDESTELQLDLAEDLQDAESVSAVQDSQLTDTTATVPSHDTVLNNIRDLDSKLVNATLELNSKDSVIADLRETVKKLESQLNKQKEDIKVLKAQSTNQKKELRNLTAERDNAVREREHSNREMVKFQDLHLDVTEERNTLLATVESLKLQRDTQPVVKQRTAPTPVVAPTPRTPPTPAPRKRRSSTASQQSDNQPPHHRPHPAPSKVKLTVVGASNMKGCGARLNNGAIDCVTWTNPGARFAQMPKRIVAMTADDSEAVVVHFGTNDVLSATSPGQALLDISDALETVEEASKVSVFVCAVPPLKNNKANQIRNMANDYFRHHCAKSEGKLIFVDPYLNRSHLVSDGVHLTNVGKDLLCGAITTAAVGFLRDPYHPSM